MKQLATSKHLPLLRLGGALAALVGSQASAATRMESLPPISRIVRLMNF